MQPLIFETKRADWEAEDSGSALIIGIDSASQREHGGEFIRLQSWTELPPELDFDYDKSRAADMQRVHPVLGQLLGKHVRVTVEVLD